ncbi:unnamed protein product [Parascedosporium putredinis]|uniref:Zinc finger CHCC-type domain-containing protein n=1 Tax=Parascedosporium putredinis TaxID=1442378 RepID=A0A9P1HD95_9PEZI|nr:unnamed protein product [Parascedosporium putredinis]CAI8003847.1 unnamed protein product [Parascedosporium putredinis]
MSTASLRTLGGLTRRVRVPARAFTTTARQFEAATQNSVPVEAEADSKAISQQAPNRVGIWARGQRARAQAMTGPRFEQTDFAVQPQPYAAIELIHQQPVKWTHDRMVACDGGGGPAGHPRIFINTDKAEIATCGYCGNPFANEHHRKHLEALPETSYP